MDVTIRTEKTYDLVGLTESQARDLLYFAVQIPESKAIPFNGRQGELLTTIRQTLLNVGLTIKDLE